MLPHIRTEMVGKKLNGRYRLDRELGRGGMGAVYQGYDLLLNRVVAVKMLLAAGLDTAGKNNLLDEARAVAQLNHPNIISVFDAGQSDDVPYVVMEYLEGDSLHEKPPKDLVETVQYAVQICNALEEAHQHGIVHRDLKPENVIVEENGTLKLTDFGLALSLKSRMDQDSSLTGTVYYISPEQALGKPLDGRSDLYALGVMLYEFAAGRVPFTGGDPLAVISQHINDLPQDPAEIEPGISADLKQVIMKLLSKDPAQRYGSASEVQNILEDTISHDYRIKTKLMHNIPLDLTSFIGREEELKEVRRLIGRTRLLTMTGVGGTGKTRLAMQAARGLVHDFKDGIWVIELSTIFEADQALRAIAAVLDMRDLPNHHLEESLCDFLRPRNLLLILDNCEHLIRTCAQITERMLSGCPNIKILVTSRESLGVAGEVTFHVPSMQQPDPEDMLDGDDVWKIESMQLFKERALSVKPDFQADESQTKAACRICARLDGIPLAIELAAARVRVMPVEEIASRLSDRFKLLTGGSRSAMPRQQTLEALIDWSHDLLTDEEKTLLRRLSIFSSGWTLEEVEAICPDAILPVEDILDVLTRLVDKSLVNSDTRAGKARFDMLETIRQYARNKLIQSGEIETLRNLHVQYFTGFAEKAGPELWRSGQVEWMDRLEDDHDNLRAAMEWSMCGGCGDDYVLNGLRIAASIFTFWMVRGYWSEGLGWIRKLLELPAVTAGESEVKTRLIYMAGFLTKEMGDILSAKEYFDRALETARSQKDRRGQAYAFLGLAEIAMIERLLDEAERNIDRCLTLFRDLDDQVGTAIALSRKGEITKELQGYEKSKSYYQENLKICREAGHILGTAGTLLSLGYNEMNYGDPALGREYLEESLNIFRSSKDKSGIAGALSAIGYADLYSEDLESSRERYEEALKINRELRSSPGIGQALIALGEISRSQGDYIAACEFYEEALQINENLGQIGIVMVVAHNLGYVSKQQGDLQQALKYFRRSLKLAKGRRSGRFKHYCILGIASVYFDLGRVDDAIRLFGAAEKSEEENSYRIDMADQKEIDKCMQTLKKDVPAEKIEQLWMLGRDLSIDETTSLAESENEKEI